MKTVLIPTALRRFTGGASSAQLDGETVVDVLRQLTELYPDLRDHLLDQEDRVPGFVNVFVNDENIRDRADRGSLSDGDEILLVPAMAGG